MNNFLNINLNAIENLFSNINIASYKESINQLNEKITPYLLAENKSLWLVGKKYFYYISPHAKKAEQWLKASILTTEFLKPAPNGKAIILLQNDVTLTINEIKEGRIADFLQAIFHKEINSANYDNTIRGQNPRLLDLSHAEQIDKLRRYMQEGKISQYEFDDYNPAYPKAGK